jgi:hypothetical protein
MAKLRPGIEFPIIPEDFIALEEESLLSGSMHSNSLRNADVSQENHEFLTEASNAADNIYFIHQLPRWRPKATGPRFGRFRSN